MIRSAREPSLGREWAKTRPCVEAAETLEKPKIRIGVEPDRRQERTEPFSRNYYTSQGSTRTITEKTLGVNMNGVIAELRSSTDSRDRRVLQHLIETVFVVNRDTHELGVCLQSREAQRCRIGSKLPLLRPPFGFSAVGPCKPIDFLSAWRGDADVDAWLVPVNPEPPTLLRRANSISYVRTVANELTYVPLLVRGLPVPTSFDVFSASYTSFLLAPCRLMLRLGSSESRSC